MSGVFIAKRSGLIIILAAVLVGAVLIGCALNAVNPAKQDGHGFAKREINIDEYTLAFELPENMSLELTYEPGENTSRMYDKNYTSSGLWKIISNDEIIGIINLDYFWQERYILEEQFARYKENPEQNYIEIYPTYYEYMLPTSKQRRYYWGTDYTVAYESVNRREGAATSLIYFGGDLLEHNEIDTSKFKEEIIDGEQYSGYYNKGVIGYNIDITDAVFVAIEFYYDSVTDEELRRIAETLRISGGEEYPLIEYDLDVAAEYSTGEAGVSVLSHFVGRDSTLKLSIDEMLAIMDGSGGGFQFYTNNVQDLYLKFVFGDTVPQEITDIFYITNADADPALPSFYRYGERHYVDNPIKVPEEKWLYNFFARVKWHDGVEENIFFRVYVEEYSDVPPAEAVPVAPAAVNDEPYVNIWSQLDFLIITHRPNGYDGAPIAMGSDNCGRDNTGEMSISEMIDSIDNMGNIFLPFTLDAVQGLYLEFSFKSDLTPAKIKDMYYVNGNNTAEIYYLDRLKIPEEIGVYNFFVNLEWTDGTEEIVYFRVEVVESYSQVEQPTDGQIESAYKSANEAMWWFHVTTMPLGKENADPDMPAEPIKFDERGAAKVNHPTIKTYNDLKNHLYNLFSNEIADGLLSSGRYFDKDGELYAIAADRGTDISKGGESYEIIRESDKKIIYRITVELLSNEDFVTVIDYEAHDMIYEYIAGKWVFTRFELFR